MIGMDSHQSLQKVGRRLRVKVSSGLPGLRLRVDPLDEVVGDDGVLGPTLQIFFCVVYEISQSVRNFLSGNTRPGSCTLKLRQ